MNPDLESDDPNPVLLTKPELKADVRDHYMPKVRQFFRHSKRTFYERIGHAEKWTSLGDGLTTINNRIDQRMVEEFGCSYFGSKKAAVIEELKLEGRE